MSGVFGTAVQIPAGSLGRWRAAKALHASQRVEVLVAGDSTTYGQTAGTDYSWVYKLRALALAAGLTDGGRGMAGMMNETAATSGESLIGISARTGFAAAGGSFDMALNYTPVSTTTSDSITFQGKGTRARIYSTQNGTNLLTGGFTYSLDGGSAVTVVADGTKGIQVTQVGPFTEGTHTLTIVNNGTALNRVGVVVDWVREAGIVFHKQGVPGASSGYMGTNPTAADSPASGIQLASMGYVATTDSSIPEWQRSLAAAPARSLSLAIFALGINNQQGSSSDNSATVANSATKFCKMARAAGADPLIVIQHYESATNSSNAALYRAALFAVSTAQQAALVDFGVGALGPTAGWVGNGYVSALSSPHLNAAGYDAQAQFLWDHILSL